MSAQQELLENVKTWLSIDDQIRALQKEIRDRRKLKKEFNFFIVKHLFLSLFYLARFLVNALLRKLRAILTPIGSK